MIGIYAYLVALFIRPQDFMPFMLGFPVVDYIAGFTLLIAFMRLIQQKRSIAAPQNYFIILFLLVVFLSNIVNNNLNTAIEQFIVSLKRVAIFFMFFVILDSSQKLKWTINFIVIAVVILAIQSIYQSIHGIGWAGQSLGGGDIVTRVNWIGLWDGPNVLCLLFVIVLPFTLEFAFGPYSALWRLINLLFTALLSCGIYLTNSRGGFFGFLAVLFFYFLTKFKNKKKAAIVGLFLGLIIISSFASFGSFAPSRMGEIRGEASAHERTWLWEQGLNLFREKPILGIGKGQWREVGHNNFVEYITEMGLAGAFIYVSLIYLSFKALYIIQRLKPNDIKGDIIILPLLARALLISMIGFNVVTFFVSMEHGILFVWLALCAVTLLIARQEIGNISLKFSMKDAVAVLLIMVVITAIIATLAIKNIV